MILASSSPQPAPVLRRAGRVLLVLLVTSTAPSAAQLLSDIAPLTDDSVGSEVFFETHRRAPPRTVDHGRVDALLEQMTVAEKIGQMTQLDIFMVTNGEHQDLRIDQEKLREMVVELGVGSILNVNGEALSVERWHEIVGAIQDAAADSRLGIPVIYGIDSIHGAGYVEGATIFPQPLGMAATFHPELMLEGSRVTAAETRRAALPWNFSPVLDVGRHPAWPRFYETFGEDPYVATVMGLASVRGYEGADLSDPRRVASSLKHYIGYSEPVTGHDRTPARIPERTLRESFLPPFRAAVAAGARSVMVNSGEINGIPVHSDGYLLRDVLREELGFDGVIVTDWEDIKKMVTVHRVAATEKEATLMAIEAGVDMSMVPRDTSFASLLAELVEEGSVSVERLDRSVRRILELKTELGLFDDPLLGSEAATEVGGRAHREVALQAARESVVLLENRDDTLPIAPDRRILVTGPTADALESLNNGWTYTWQGTGASNYPHQHLTLAEALEALAGDVVRVATPFESEDPAADRRRAREAAADADLVVLGLGEFSYTETPGNIDDLRLPEDQLALAEAVLTAGKPVVLVLVEGRPRVLDGLAEKVQAVVLASNPGMEGGQALAEVLLGRHNPSGRLPFTYPRHTNALRTYDYKLSESQDTEFGLTAFDPQWHFGRGLSYTEFTWSDLALGETSAGLRESVDVSVRVTNSGSRAGAVSTLLFVTDEVATITPSVRRLRRFTKVHLRPGESKTLTFRLGPADFEFTGRDLEPTIEPGSFRISVAGLSAALELIEP